MMNLSSSFDHRVIDGADAAEFIQRIKRAPRAPGPAVRRLSGGAHVRSSVSRPGRPGGRVGDARRDGPVPAVVAMAARVRGDRADRWRRVDVPGAPAAPLHRPVHDRPPRGRGTADRRSAIDGDIAGTARVDLSGRDGGCEIRLRSTLSPRGRTVRLAAGLARPIARIGHDWVLDTGARQFAMAVDGRKRVVP